MYVCMFFFCFFSGRNFNSIILFWLDLRSDSEAFNYIELVDATNVYEEREKEGGNQSEEKKNQEIGVKKCLYLASFPGSPGTQMCIACLHNFNVRVPKHGSLGMRLVYTIKCI